MRILNLYAGIGGNRKYWLDDEVTAVEIDPEIADSYRYLYPRDTVVVEDAHQYLLEHFQEFDFIWSSPPCPTHSRVSTGLAGWGIYRYPDMALYEEIIFLKHFFKGNWVVENVIPYYDVLISPRVEIDRHLFWSNKGIDRFKHTRTLKGAVTDATKEALAEYHDIHLPPTTKNLRKLLRNAVHPDLGLHIYKQLTAEQGVLL